ncbi:precorrin-6y C5,15-methyltransferase (decarboxylating) subunit CbiE [Arenibacterium halophilum]|uniref:Precorrin-6y C5,15-methyltransferase (Decarboxylating) subunit CbiE n=1 Tax=Arenibacterium halophilum TaxID=2583821 RepID=A0ABY2X9D9_9RHOB|nr:precorrin-6y C5,15-methyltransferase (decarboxylating) subunit CbiE [Arenibacterium halophilum]TMV12989.1 precorrin-6y C5,15-methyltransferase (decarboxylating) subunit CbiE [Arenibacterium halophilum]
MSEDPWLSIIGLGEDGPDGLSPATRQALARAEIVMGPLRHLALLGETGAETIAWPVPFADGVERLLALRGRRVAVLASGDPFWFGAGSVLAARLSPGEWRAYPGPSCFSLAAARLGWPLERTACFSLHAAPFERLRAHLAPGARAIATLRDGAAVNELAAWLTEQGFGLSSLRVMEALGGPRERVRLVHADACALADVAAPVCVAIEVAGTGRMLTRAAGRADEWFDNDGQITKRPVRALTLSALAPRAGEHLWDIGAGSGSIALEWLLSGDTCTATAIEGNAARASNIRANAARLGVDHRLTLVEGRTPEVLTQELAAPDAVFIGGGLSQDLLDALWVKVAPNTRLVANAVTLESEALLAAWHEDKGGDMLRIELAKAKPLGNRRGWASAYPIVQWSVTR